MAAIPVIMMMGARGGVSLYSDDSRCRVCNIMCSYCVTCDHNICINNHIQRRNKNRIPCEKHIYLPTKMEKCKAALQNLLKCSN